MGGLNNADTENTSMLGKIRNTFYARPFDFYLYTLAPCILTILAIVQVRSLSKIYQTILLPFITSDALGVTAILPLLLCIGLYLLLKFAAVAVYQKPSLVILKKAMRVFVSALFVATLGLLMVCIFGTTLKLTGMRNPESVRGASATLMRIDTILFTTFLPVSLQKIGIAFPMLDMILVRTYQWFWYVIIGTATVLAFLKITLLRGFYAQFLLVFLLGIPFWFAVPAISPDEFYRHDIFNIVNTKSTPPLVAAPATAALSDMLLKERVWSKPDIGHFAVTSFPSMHVAWSIIAAYALIRLWRPLAIPAFSWVLTNSISTVYTLQHYAVDAILGVALAVSCIALCNRLLARSDARAHRPLNMPHIVTLMERDTYRAFAWLTSRGK